MGGTLNTIYTNQFSQEGYGKKLSTFLVKADVPRQVNATIQLLAQHVRGDGVLHVEDSIDL